MKKIPWGVIAAVCAMILSFAVIAVIAVFVVSNMMFSVAGSDDGLRESWWLIPIYIVMAITFIGFCGSTALFVLKRKKQKNGEA